MRFPSFRLEDKIALVTGGGSGIGKTLALGFAHAGADVAVAGRRLQRLEETVREIRKLGREGLAVRTDVTKSEDVQRMVERVLERFGRIDILLNAAGINARFPAEEVPEEVWDGVLETNLKGTFLCCQAVGRVMIEGGGGRIINIGSLTSQIGIGTIAPYSASKGGVLQLTRALAAEWARYGIRVNCIGPGYFRTEMTQALFEDKRWVRKAMDRIPMKRFGEVEDLIGVAIFLASDASDYVTGQIIYVDGGFLGCWTGGMID
jgi:NAD(P)-dependent dehydrogenase (short-subunit alcohol dehydrogenase family)